MTMQFRVLALLLAACLSACTKSEPQRGCQTPPADWRKPHAGPGLEIIRIKVTLDRRGQIFWNGIAVSGDRFRALLKRSRELDPMPNVYLEAAVGAPCRDLEDALRLMTSTLDCHNGAGPCVEGLPDNVPRPGHPEEGKS